MKLSYQIATPEVKLSPAVTAYQADLEMSFARLKECGYDGVELMVCDPAQLDHGCIKRLSDKYTLPVSMICTGEVFGQGGFYFSDLDDERRGIAIQRAKSAVDLAAILKAQMNIGRIRGGYLFKTPPEPARQRSVDGMREVARYAAKRGVIMALEPVNAIASNFINTTQEGIAVAVEISEPACKLMLDSNHMFINDLDMTQSIYDAREYVSFVHLADSNRLYPGNCKLDFASFIGTLKNIGYDGWLSVEVFQRPDQDTALEKSIAHIRPLL